MINRKILNRCRLLLSGLLLSMVGCSSEQLISHTDQTDGTPVEMRLQVDTAHGATLVDNETAINRLRVVVFGSIGSPDSEKLILNKYYATAPEDNNLKEVITTGRRDIYIIVNEPLTGAGHELESYKNIATVSDIRNLSLIYQGVGSIEIYTPDEIPMFLGHQNQQIRLDAPNEISGEVERTMAKVTMKLNVKHSGFPAGRHAVIDNIVIKNLPEKSYLIAKNYSDAALVASEKQNAKVIAAQSGYDFSSNNTFYVPEYLFSNPENGAYIEITGHVNSEPYRITKWSVKLGDAMDDGGRYGNRFDITRNRHYTFTGDVKSYGQMDDLAVKVTVLPWNTVNMDEDIGGYVAFSSVTNAADYFIEDGSNLDEVGETIKVSCNTNTGGWYTVTRNEKGAVVHRSSPTAAVSAVATQTVSIAIPQMTAASYLSNYTVSIYHPTIAQESIGPIKLLNFTQHGGAIPNSVLLAAGWPADRLPAIGLQVATRGNVLPGGTPAADDPTMEWSTEYVTTSIMAVGLGAGKGNYAQLAAKDAVTYPIGHICKDLGSEWYVPSTDELALLYNNKSIFGASYTFNDSYYWSATENSSSSSWYVHFSDGYTFTTSKTYTARARCLREI